MAEIRDSRDYGALEWDTTDVWVGEKGLLYSTGPWVADFTDAALGVWFEIPPIGCKTK